MSKRLDPYPNPAPIPTPPSYFLRMVRRNVFVKVRVPRTSENFVTNIKISSGLCLYLHLWAVRWAAGSARWAGRWGGTSPAPAAGPTVRSPEMEFKETVSRDGYFFWKFKHFDQHFRCMRWWFSRPFKSFTLPCTIINFMFASLKLLTNFENAYCDPSSEFPSL
jgi:hypothetical protein